MFEHNILEEQIVDNTWASLKKLDLYLAYYKIQLVSRAKKTQKEVFEKTYQKLLQHTKTCLEQCQHERIPKDTKAKQLHRIMDSLKSSELIDKDVTYFYYQAVTAWLGKLEP